MSTYIIAEAGVNHNGDIQLALKLVDEAKKAGANCVKFQTFKAEKVVSKFANMAEYQVISTKKSETQLEMLKKLELTYDEFVEIRKYCDKVQIDFMSTAFDLDTIDFLNSLEMKKWKIPSGEITNLPYLERIAQLKKPIILSTGMSTLTEIENAIAILKKNGAIDITVLHCTTEYPAPFEDVNLKAMNTIKKKFNIGVGYSDHTMGIEVPIAAVALGASVIEKHFTLNRDSEGPDHKASLEPNELFQMVSSIRNIEKALGDGVKRLASSELKNKSVARKSIVANVNIKKGELFTKDNLTTKRPGNGISPMHWYDVIGKKASRNFDEDELIEL